MESLTWALRTLSGFTIGVPIVELLLFVLLVWWDYPIMLVWLLAARVRAPASSRSNATAGWLPVLVVIPSLLRKRDELTSMMSTVESVATNGYPGELLIVLSIDGTRDSPELYGELQAWAERQHYGDRHWLYVTGTEGRRSKPMAIDQAIDFVKGLVRDGVHAAFPPIYVSTDADADLGENALTAIVRRLQRRHWLTGWPARAVAGALHVRGNVFWRGWRRFFTVEGQLNLQVAREYYVSNVSRYNIRWLPSTGVPGAFYCTWSDIFVSIPSFLGYLRTLRLRHWIGWWVGIAPPRFSDSTAAPMPELMAGDTDDTVSAYIATLARYEDGRFVFDPPKTPLHALFYMLRGLFIDRALRYEPNARVFTSSPTTIKSLLKQRMRWNASRLELTGRLWPAFGYHWMLGLPGLLILTFMIRSLILGFVGYFVLPALFWNSHSLTLAVLAYFGSGLVATMLTTFTLTMNGELRYWRLLFAAPLTPIYNFYFNWLAAAIGVTSDLLLFGNVTGFAPEGTLIRGGSSRVALMFRIRRVFHLAVRSVVHGDVPFGRFWFGWGETKWTPNGYEGWTSGKRRRAIVPPVSTWFRSRPENDERTSESERQ
jgi:hypothetical protein